jgi:hypothetical protein
MGLAVGRRASVIATERIPECRRKRDCRANALPLPPDCPVGGTAPPKRPENAPGRSYSAFQKTLYVP